MIGKDPGKWHVITIRVYSSEHPCITGDDIIGKAIIYGELKRYSQVSLNGAQVTEVSCRIDMGHGFDKEEKAV